MDEDLRKILEENQSLLRKNLEISQNNEKKIKKIQAHIRRTMIAKYLYWVIVISIAAGAVYVAQPYVEEGIQTYNSFKENVNRSSEIINNPGSVFQDVNLIQRLFGS